MWGVLVFFIYGFDFLDMEPDIQCTVIKVHRSIKFDEIKKFPQLYHTISNDSAKSRLLIAGKEFPEFNPKILSKNTNSETIEIPTPQVSLRIELSGKPMSRNGFLKINGESFAEITCH